MENKRYAIVRVECPPRNEIDAQFVCFPNDNNCGGCRYGDTKEQLIRKIETAIQIADTEYIKGNMPEGKEDRKYAEIIVKFLGVKE